jgi:hypothetical protein
MEPGRIDVGSRSLKGKQIIVTTNKKKLVESIAIL